MARQYPVSRKPGITSITYWRKFAQHRLIYLLLAGIFGVGMVAYFGTGPLGGARGADPRQTRGQDEIATVNGEPVTRAEFDQQWEPMRRFGEGSQGVQFQGMILTNLVDTALARNISKSRGLKVTDSDIDKAISEMKKGKNDKPISDSEFQDRLDQQGVSLDDLRDDLRKSLLPQTLRQTFVDQIKVSDEDFKRTFDEVKLRKIVLYMNKLPEAQLKTKADKILAEVKAGKDFAELANQFTDDAGNKSPHYDPKTKKTSYGAPKGGDMGWTAVANLGKEETEAIKPLKKGEVTGVVKMPYAFEIFKVEDIRSNLPKDFDKNKTKLLEDYKTRQASEAFGKFMEEQRAKANIVWKDPSFKWRYAYGKSNPMMGGMMTADTFKKQDELKGELRPYVDKNPDDSQAALVLADMLNKQYQISPPGPQRDKLRDDVEKYYETGLKHSEDQQVRLQLARMYQDSGRKDDALRHYSLTQRLLRWDKATYTKATHIQLEKAFKELGREDLASEEGKTIALLTEQEKKEAEERKKEDERKKLDAQKKTSAVPVGSGDKVVAPGGTLTVSPTITSGKVESKAAAQSVNPGQSSAKGASKPVGSKPAPEPPKTP